MDNNIYDLIYCEDRAEYRDIQAILKGFDPYGRFEDASDFVHEYRFVFISNAEQDAYFKALIEADCIMQSIGFNFLMHEDIERAKRLVYEVKPELRK